MTRTAVAILTLLVTVLVGSLGAASAAVGPTDLALTKSDSPDPITEDNTLTYTIQVQNAGPGDATAVTVSDTLPNQVDFISSSTSAGSCSRSGRTVTCDLGTLNTGLTATVKIDVKASDDGTVSNTASVITTVMDTNTANDQATATTTVNKKPATVKTKKTKTKKGKGKGCSNASIVGTAGDDAITGTSRADTIVTFTGNDSVVGGGGNDIICTGNGADFVNAGPGNDFVAAGPGPDRLLGDIGNDQLKGSRGRDRLRGSLGDDALVGGRNRDRCNGGPGNDTLAGCP